MTALTAGITPAGEGIDGVVWNILGQTYKPVVSCDSCFAFDTLFPDGTFVPPHIHPTQDEFLYILDGRFDFVLDGKPAAAEPGDLVRLPMGIPHGIFNKTDGAIKCLFWVSPTRRLYDLFWALHALGPDADPADVVAVSARHEVDFLPPEAG